MLTGTIEGRFLEFLVYATGARRVLELGTYSGYSAISMAAALPAEGRIDTCEVDEQHAAVAHRYIEEAGLSDRITIHLGPALETIARLEGEFDFVFIDADKENYVNYYEAVLP
jgi:caffeoyl-CoA O-methyltransferase